MSEKAIRVGDLVRMKFGATEAIGMVKEDRGPIGVKGRRLYLIHYSLEPEAGTVQIELPAEEFEPVKGAASVK